MKLIHCADLHLDAKLNRHLTPEKAKERNAELLHTFVRLVRFASQEGVEGILIAGDLFDTGKVAADTKSVLLSEIQTHPQITFYYLKGNHDKNTFLLNLEEIPKNLKLFGRDWVSYLANPKGAANIVITGVELSPEGLPSLYDKLQLDPKLFHIVMLHGQETEYRDTKDGERISISHLRNRGIDYLALGHIHAFREGRLDRRGEYCYAGCLEGRGFDECGVHGFVLLDIDESNLSYTKTFVPFAKRSLYEVYVDVSSCVTTSERIAAVRKVLQQENYSTQSLLKIIFTGQVSAESEANLKYIQQYFQQSYYFVKVEDRTTVYVDLQEFQYDQSLSGEFVRIVLQQTDLDEEEKNRIVRYGLRALAGEELFE